MAGVLGSNATLVCGTELASNPPASISWRDNRGNPVDLSSSKFEQSRDPSAHTLLVRDLVSGDGGTWTCDIHVDRVGTVQHSITLIVVGKQRLHLAIICDTEMKCCLPVYLIFHPKNGYPQNSSQFELCVYDAPK